MYSRNRAPLIVLGLVLFILVALFATSYLWTPTALTHVENIELDPAALGTKKPTTEPQVEYP